MSAREELLAQARRHMWAAWQLSSEELASQAADTLFGLGMLVPEGGAQELAKLRESLRDACDQIAALELELGGATARVAELEAERHVTNEALDNAVQALREREQRDVELEHQRADHFTEAARLLEDVGRDDDAVNLLDNVAAGIRSHAAPLEDPHDSPLHHAYRVPRDLPPLDGAPC